MLLTQESLQQTLLSKEALKLAHTPRPTQDLITVEMQHLSVELELQPMPLDPTTTRTERVDLGTWDNLVLLLELGATCPQEQRLVVLPV